MSHQDYSRGFTRGYWTAVMAIAGYALGANLARRIRSRKHA